MSETKSSGSVFMNATITGFDQNGKVITESFPVRNISCDSPFKKQNPYYPEKVIYNGRTCIVIWSDGTKNISTADPKDEFSEEDGFLRCLASKVFESKQKYRRMVHSRVSKNIYKKVGDEMVPVGISSENCLRGGIISIDEFKKITTNASEKVVSPTFKGIKKSV